MRIPSNVRTVAEIIGLSGAIRLAQATGSNHLVYIPSGPIRPGHPIASCLQADEISKLQHHFRGEPLPYPQARGLKRMSKSAAKMNRIKAMHATGSSVTFIAQAVGCSDAYVRRIIKKGKTSSGWTRKCEKIRNNESQICE